MRRRTCHSTDQIRLPCQSAPGQFRARLAFLAPAAQGRGHLWEKGVRQTVRHHDSGICNNSSLWQGNRRCVNFCEYRIVGYIEPGLGRVFLLPDIVCQGLRLATKLACCMAVSTVARGWRRMWTSVRVAFFVDVGPGAQTGNEVSWSGCDMSGQASRNRQSCRAAGVSKTVPGRTGFPPPPVPPPRTGSGWKARCLLGYVCGPLTGCHVVAEAPRLWWLSLCSAFGLVH